MGASGLAAVAIVHDLSMLGLSVLVIGHVYFTLLYGALPAMWTGYVTEEYARAEHLAWFEAVSRGTSAEPPHAREPPSPDETNP